MEQGITVRRIAELDLAQEGFAFDRKTGRAFAINTTAEAILRLLRDGHSQDDAITILARRCGQRPAVAAAGVRAFMSQLERHLQ